MKETTCETCGMLAECFECDGCGRDFCGPHLIPVDGRLFCIGCRPAKD